MEEGFMLSPLDLIILGVIGFGMYRGATKGLLNRATTVFAIVAGIIFGFRLKPLAESLFVDYLRLNLAPEFLVLLSFVTAFVVVFVIVSTVLNYLSGIFKSEKFKLDNALGAVFGGFLATLALSVAFILLSYFGFPSGSSRSESALYPYVRDFSRYTLGVGADVLREANSQISKYGFDKPGGESGGASNQTPSNAPIAKPNPIR